MDMTESSLDNPIYVCKECGNTTMIELELCPLCKTGRLIVIDEKEYFKEAEARRRHTRMMYYAVVVMLMIVMTFMFLILFSTL